MEYFGYLIGVFWLLMLIIAAIVWVMDYIHKHWGKKPEGKKPLSFSDCEKRARNFSSSPNTKTTEYE